MHHNQDNCEFSYQEWFPPWFLELFYLPFSFFFGNVSLPHLFLSASYCKYIPLDTQFLLIYYLSFDTSPQSYQKNLHCCHLANKTKSSDMCQFQFYNIFRINFVQNNLKGTRTCFTFNHYHHFIFHIDKLTLIYSVFNTILTIVVIYLLFLVNFLLFYLYRFQIWLPSFWVLWNFSLSFLWTYL